VSIEASLPLMLTKSGPKALKIIIIALEPDSEMSADWLALAVINLYPLATPTNGRCQPACFVDECTI
jgi:hypothetical protein